MPHPQATRQRDPRVEHGCGSEGQFRATRACRWAWRTSREVLWRDFLKHNPGNPSWADRDRFVLSNGHGSMLLYSLLHLTGYPLTIDDLQELPPVRLAHRRAPRASTSTSASRPPPGPLGQGLANAVGMALAEKILAATFNRPGHDIVDHRTWVFLGDGCLMEGISHEACSLAGTLGLGKLICFYDDNGISIDGEVHGWFTDDTPRRFEAYGWQVIRARRRPRSRTRSQRAIAEAQGRNDAPDADLLQDHHRLGRAEQAGHRGHARRGARRRRGRSGAQDARLALRAVRDPGRDSQRPGTRASAAPRPRSDWTARLGGLSQGLSRTSRPSSSAASTGELPDGWRKALAEVVRAARREARRRGDALVVAAGAERARRGDAGTARRLGRPHRFEQHAIARARRTITARRHRRQLHALRRARVRHDRHHERHRAARRLRCLSAARSWCSPTTRAMPCAWRR